MFLFLFLFFFVFFIFFFFNDTATTEIYTLSLHDALPISSPRPGRSTFTTSAPRSAMSVAQYGPAITRERSSTRMPSSIIGPSATIEESLRHRVDFGHPGTRDRVDAGLDLRHRLERLGGQRLG